MFPRHITHMLKGSTVAAIGSDADSNQCEWKEQRQSIVVQLEVGPPVRLFLACARACEASREVIATP